MKNCESNQYDSEEVNRIIRRALKLSNEDTISHEELIETAAQVGLDPSVVEIAIKAERREYQKERTRQAALRRRKAGFQWHLWSYLVVNAALLLINNLIPGPWWFHWSVLGWGVGLAFHFKAVYFPGRKRFDRCLKSHPFRTGVIMCEK
jgi:hypothetical protein